jgi:hypothetical protein
MSKSCPRWLSFLWRKLNASKCSQAKETMSVDYETIQKIQKLGDDVLIGVVEVAALTGFSILTVRQRKLPGLEPVPGLSRLRWRLGDLRQWMRYGPQGNAAADIATNAKDLSRPMGRPTKKSQVEGRK